MSRANAIARGGVVFRAACFLILAAVFAILWPAPAAHAGSDDYKYEYKYNGCKYKYKESKHGYKEEYKCEGHVYDRPKYKYETKHEDCKYKYEESEKGYKEEYKCKYGRPVRASGGYWPKHDKRGPAVLHGAPFGIDQGNCNRRLIGGLLGGVAGGVLGAQVGDGDKQLIATAAGTFLGAVVGSEIGRQMDETDRTCAGQALEHAPDNQTITWNNRTDATQYELTPSRTFNDSKGRMCRDYHSTALVAGQQQKITGTACRQPDGSWQIVSK